MDESGLLFACILRFGQYIGRTAGRKVLLLIDNCFGHGSKDILPILQNVEVHFLPPNTTSKIQLLDAGIIAALKAKFRRKLLFRVFYNIDAGRKSIYNVTF
eukprot:IDg22968t1